MKLTAEEFHTIEPLLWKASTQNPDIRACLDEIVRLRQREQEAQWLLSHCEPRDRDPFTGPADWTSRYDVWHGRKGDR